MRYQIVVGMHPSGLALHVNKLLERGWVPIGGVAVEPVEPVVKGFATQYLQALVEPSTPKDAMEKDPHADHWEAITVASNAITASPNVTQEQCIEFCAALDRLSSSLMGEAQEDHERMNWLVAHCAGIEIEQDGIGVRVTLPRRYGEPVRLEWHTNLRHAIDRARVRALQKVVGQESPPHSGT